MVCLRFIVDLNHPVQVKNFSPTSRKLIHSFLTSSTNGSLASSAPNEIQVETTIASCGLS
jgi:hypothetical protein